MSDVNETEGRLVVFEDSEGNYKKIAAVLKPVADRVGYELVRFAPAAGVDAGDGVRAALTDPGLARLVILDWDLTKYLPTRIDRALVRGLCAELGIPLCSYHAIQGEHDQVTQLMRWADTEMVIDSSYHHEQIATQVARIFGGVVEVSNVVGAPKSNLRDTLVAVLRAPESVALELEQYSRGQSAFLRIATAEDDERSRVATTQISYWIHNQLLQFPGALLNAVAASSHLDIAEADFQRDEVRAIFAEAEYKGPFAELGPFWWTAILDEVCGRAMGAEDRRLINGRETARRQGVECGPARCLRDHDGAGYFCLVNRKPICAEHSAAPEGWVPLGASKSRVESEKYDELSAWLS